MIRLTTLLLFITCGALAGTTNESVGGLRSVATVWGIPTTNWPDALWVYKVIPQNFAAPVVSNLMAIGSFTEKSRTKAPAYLTDIDKKTLYFGDDSKHLAICPMLGYIEYRDGSADARMGEPVVGVPDEDAVLPLAIKYLRAAGIDQSQLAVRSNGISLALHGEKRDRSYIDKRMGQRVEVVDSRGLFFLRRIDNIAFTGIGVHGGASIRFGNNSNIVDLKISWRNLVPYELRACITPRQISEWIQSGRATLQSPPQSIPERISRFTISKITFLYDGKPGDEPMDFASPFALVDVAAEGSLSTNSLTFKVSLILPSESH